MRPLRRPELALSPADSEQLLAQGEYGVLSSVDAQGQPYAIPLNYAFGAGSIYFHCALSGHKLDNLAANPRVCFCVVGRTELLPAEFDTRYQSVLAFGTASEVSGAERRNALGWLVEKYSPCFRAEGERYIERHDAATRVFKIHLDHFSGKARR